MASNDNALAYPGGFVSRPDGVFEATSTQLARCECGCNTLKLVALDEADQVGAIISYDPEVWLDYVLPGIEAEARKMLGRTPS